MHGFAVVLPPVGFEVVLPVSDHVWSSGQNGITDNLACSLQFL